MYISKEMLITEPIIHYDRGSLKSSLNSYDLPGLINNIKQERTWEEGEMKAVILQKSPARKILLTVLHKGTQIISYQADDSITFQVIEGKLDLHFRNESFILKKGEILIINEKLKYKIDSVEDSAFLMILASGN